ncbi:MAG: right-handed parallel beta-helix repeat-containing protein [Bacteroidota bacterium]
MKKIFTLFISLVGLCSASNAALSGTYTVGGTTPDYATPQAAAAAAASQGVNGPVIFNIRPGTYTGNINLTAIAGASATNSVTFQAENGDSTSVILTYAAGSGTTDNFTFSIFGADYVTLRQLTMRRDGAGAYGTVVRVDNISIGVTIENCLIYSIPTTATNTNAVGIFSPVGGTSIDSNLTVRNNNIYNGSYGIHLAGPNATFREPNTIIENNRILNCGNRGIHVQESRRPRIYNNIIESVPTTTQFIGIYISNADRGMEIIGNRVVARSTSGLAYALNMITVSANAGQEGIVANNFFAASTSSNGYGILLQANSYIDFYYNSTNVTGTATTSAGIGFTGTASNNIRLMNNIFVSPRYGIETAAGFGAALTVCNYNDLFGGTGAGSWNGTPATTLADWQAASGLDANSTSGDPQYVSFIDLHATSGVVNGNAMPIASITTDIDGNLRDAVAPDMGAAEFTPLADNVGVVSFISPKNSSCGNDQVQVSVVIRNFGGVAQSNIPVTTDVSGVATANLTETYAGPLNPGASDTVVFSQLLNTIAGGTLSMTAYTSLTGDQDNTNDTLFGSANFIAIPNPPTTVSFSYCPGTTIFSTTDSGYTTFWFEADTSSSPLFIGNDYDPQLTTDDTLWVETRQDGAGGCLRITEIAQDDPSPPSGDYIEIQNISGLPFDATGWKVVASDGGTTINTINPVQWDLGLFQAGEIQYKTDNSTTNYWGSNLLFNPNQNGWIMLIDQNGQVQDFVAFGWTAGDIQGMSVNVAGFTINPGSQWSGDGAIACGAGVSVSRTGSSDNDNSSDWTCSPYTLGTQNPGLSTNFSGCGYGACASQRIPVSVTVLPAVSVTLGADTSFQAPFTYTLDAGSGYAAYLWSDGSTAQTLDVTTAGTYYVSVTNIDGCIGSDTVNISVTTGINSANASSIRLFPNPAVSELNISGLTGFSGNYRLCVLDLQGREVFTRNLNGLPGDRLTIPTDTWAEGAYTLRIEGDDFYLRRQVVIVRN